MFSQLIIKEKPHVVAPFRRPVVTNYGGPGGENKSLITNDGSLQDFLLTTPKEGTWVYRKTNPMFDIDTALTDTGQCQYIIRVLDSLAHLEMKYSRTTGFPETHELITSVPYSTGDHYRRFVDIRDYIPLTNEQVTRFISAELQNHIQTIIAPGT